MKNLSRNLLLFFTVLWSISAFSQDTDKVHFTSDIKANLAGKWYASSTYEWIDQAGIQFSKFCHFGEYSTDDFEITFTRDTIQFASNGTVEKVAYHLDYKLIVFKYKDYEYKFRTLNLNHKCVILEDDEGFLFVLTRKKPE